MEFPSCVSLVKNDSLALIFIWWLKIAVSYILFSFIVVYWYLLLCHGPSYNIHLCIYVEGVVKKTSGKETYKYKYMTLILLFFVF